MSGGETFSARCSFNKVTENAQRVGWLSQRSFKAAALDYSFTTPILAGIPVFRWGVTYPGRGTGEALEPWPLSGVPTFHPIFHYFSVFSIGDTELCYFQSKTPTEPPSIIHSFIAYKCWWEFKTVNAKLSSDGLYRCHAMVVEVAANVDQ
jgi:hypothetical protein